MALDPDAQRLLDVIAMAGRPPVETMTPKAARAAYRESRRAMQGPAVDVAETRDLDAGGVPIRLYRGLDAIRGAGLLYLHGGGWVLGDLGSHDNVCRRLANEGRCRVVSVEYRLAPEHPSPAALQDSATALAYVAANGPALGIDPERLAVGGDSAGGHLAALLALAGRDGAGLAPCFQVLLYPATDLSCSNASYDQYTDGLPLTASGMRWFRDQYLQGADPGDPAISPLSARLHNLPPAFVLTAGYDPLRDEGIAYAQALDAAGVEVAHLHMATQVHGFLTMDRIIPASHAVLTMAGAALQDRWRRL